jgi:hypothetical protein
MRLSRFILAAIAGACAFWIFIFLGATFDPGYDSTGVIFWDGVIGGEFSLGYLVMLYLPPLLLVACSYFALRRPRGE